MFQDMLGLEFIGGIKSGWRNATAQFRTGSIAV
jgi:hypothetical protein